MKTANFSWGWNNNPRTPESARVTRADMVRRLRAYRRASDTFQLERLAPNLYRVTHLKTNRPESATFSTRGA